MRPTNTAMRLVRLVFAGLFACAIFGFPLVSTLPVFLGVESRPISLAYRALVAGVSVVVLVRGFLMTQAFIHARYVIVVCGLMGLLTLRLLWDALLAPLPLDLNWMEIWPFALGVTFLPAAAFLLKVDTETLEIARRWSLRLGVLAATAVIAAALVALRDVATFLRLDTGVLNPISIGHVGVSLFVLLLLRPSRVKEPDGWRRRLRSASNGLGLIIAAALIIASGSKGPLLAWLVVMLVWLFTLGRASILAGLGLRRVIWPLFLLVSLVLSFVVLNAIVSLPIIERVLNVAQDQSTSERVRLLSQAIAQFEESPVVGSAIFEYDSRIYPHNILVEVLMVGGVVALVPLLIMLFEGIRAAAICLFQVCRERWLVLLYLQYLVDAMFSGSLFYSPQFWLISVVMLGLASRPPGSPALHGQAARTPTPWGLISRG